MSCESITLQSDPISRNKRKKEMIKFHAGAAWRKELITMPPEMRDFLKLQQNIVSEWLESNPFVGSDILMPGMSEELRLRFRRLFEEHYKLSVFQHINGQKIYLQLKKVC
jgi:hypothetical protein